MDSYEINKIVGAVLGTLLFVMGIGFLAEAIYAPITDRGPGYTLPSPEGGEHGAEVAVVVETIPLSVLLASASAEDGAKVAKKCASCHNFDQGGGNKTGPALFDIVGSGLAAVDGFSYSDILSEMSQSGQTWTYEALNEFLISPKAFAPGTKMTFPGLRKEKDRANILAYLQSLSETPVPFPAVENVAVEEEMADEAHEATEETATH